MGAECPASHSGQSLVVSAFTSLSGVHCEPSLLPPLQRMLEQLLGDGSSAKTALPGLIPQQGFAQPSLVPNPSPALHSPPAWGCSEEEQEPGPAQSPFLQTGQELLLQQPQADHSPAASTSLGKNAQFSLLRVPSPLSAWQGLPEGSSWHPKVLSPRQPGACGSA